MHDPRAGGGAVARFGGSAIQPAAIQSAAAVFAARILRHAGGTLPTVCTDRACYGDDWLGLVESFGIEPAPVWDFPRRFQARLLYVPRRDAWLFQYNKTHTCRAKIRYVVHEIAEKIAIDEYPADHDEAQRLLGYNYSGYPDREDLRHIIAREIEGLFFEPGRMERVVTGRAGIVIEPEIVALFGRQVEAITGVIHRQIDVISDQLAIIRVAGPEAPGGDPPGDAQAGDAAPPESTPPD